MKKLSLLVLSMMSTFFLFSQTPGTLDFSFGNNGTSLIDFGGSSNHCLSSDIQPDQKIVMTGYTYNGSKDMSFARLNTDGTLDPGFGSGGIITHVFGATDEQMNDVLVQPDGFISGGGYTFDGEESAMIVVRLTPFGLFDNTFSSDGMVSVDFGFIEDSWGEAIALQDDGKIIVAGHLRDLVFDLQCGIARLNPDGSLDNSFGTNGVVIKGFQSMDNYINNVAMQDDKIVVGGMSYDGDDFFITIARFTTEGIADPGFGVNGYISTPFNIDPWVFTAMGAMCVDAENRILFGVSSEDADEGDFAIYRYLPDGENDMSFGIDGELIIELPGSNSIRAISTQYDNKILATGWSDTGGTPIVRLLENGDLDPDFGTNGTGVVFNGTIFPASSLNIQDDGLIICTGDAHNGSDVDFVASRYFSGLDVGIPSIETKAIDLNIHPNPFTQETTLAYELESPEDVLIEAYDAQGRLVDEIVNRGYDQGEHQLRWNAQSLPDGIYIIKMMVGDKIYTSKILKSH